MAARSFYGRIDVHWAIAAVLAPAPFYLLQWMEPRSREYRRLS